MSYSLNTTLPGNCFVSACSFKAVFNKFSPFAKVVWKLSSSVLTSLEIKATLSSTYG